MKSNSLSLVLSSAQDTSRLAQNLAPHLEAGDVVLLEGDIGAGKTHFARSLIQELLPVPEDVPSPTFTLVQVYEVHQFEIWHADLYRLTSPDEVIELGLMDAFEDAVCLIEWPDRLAELAPKSALSLSLSMTEIAGQRTLEANWSDEKWVKKLAGLNGE